MTIKACKDTSIKECSCGYKSNSLYNYNKHISNCVIFDYDKIIKEKDEIINEKEEAIAELTLRGEEAIADLTLRGEEAITDLTIEMKKEINIRDVKIDKLNKKIIELTALAADGGGQIKVYEKHPVTKNNITNNTNYVHPKLVNVKCDTIRPFTIETVREDIANGEFTYDNFLKGIKGIADFISNMTIQDDQKSYVCTDASRSKFHRLLESRKWKDDNGATFLNNIFDELADPCSEYYKKILYDAHTPPAEGENDDRDYHDAVLQKIKPIYFAINDKKSKHRPDVLNKVRNEVKNLAAI
jgi:hypothetical protein